MLKKLAREYSDLEEGALIDKHLEQLRVFDIRGSKHLEHPHRMLRVYISRKALKHFVESRKKELSKHHYPDQVTENIDFALDRIQETITNFDRYELEPPKHFYFKDYSHVGKPSVRILLEIKDARLEIISIHFTKSKKQT